MDSKTRSLFGWFLSWADDASRRKDPGVILNRDDKQRLAELCPIVEKLLSTTYTQEVAVRKAKGKLIRLAEYCERAGIDPRVARAAASRGAIPGAAKDGREWFVPVTCKWQPRDKPGQPAKLHIPDDKNWPAVESEEKKERADCPNGIKEDPFKDVSVPYPYKDIE